MTKTTIFVTTNFVGYHRWKDAPEDVGFLANWHRHIFGVRLEVGVSHGDRDVEFFQLKRQLSAFLTMRWEGTEFEASCEFIAKSIFDFFSKNDYDVISVSVDEDRENGATVKACPEKGVA